MSKNGGEYNALFKKIIPFVIIIVIIYLIALFLPKISKWISTRLGVVQMAETTTTVGNITVDTTPPKISIINLVNGSIQPSNIILKSIINEKGTCQYSLDNGGYLNFSSFESINMTSDIPLGNYPKPLCDGGLCNFYLVYGKNGSPEDVAAGTDIITRLSGESYVEIVINDTLTNNTITIKKAIPLTVSVSKFDTEIADPGTVGRNLILIGTPCSNLLIAKLAERQFIDTCDNWSLNPGEGMIMLIPNAFAPSQYALIISGDESGVRNAGYVLQKFDNINIAEKLNGNTAVIVTNEVAGGITRLETLSEVLQFSQSLNNLSEGTHKLDIKCKDISDNENIKSISFTVSTQTTTVPTPTIGGDHGGRGTTQKKKSQSWDKITLGKAEIMNVNDADIGLKLINITVKNPAQFVTITVTKLTGKPASVVHNISGKVYKYIEITPTNLPDDNLDKGKIQFQVNKSWITNNKIDRATITLNRYKNNNWEKLTTREISEDNDYVYCEAESPGFSTFAVTGEEEVITTITTSLPTKTTTTTLSCVSIGNSCTSNSDCCSGYCCKNICSDKECEGGRGFNTFNILSIVGLISVSIIIGYVFYTKFIIKKVPEKIEPPVTENIESDLQSLRKVSENFMTKGYHIKEFEDELTLAENAIKNGLIELAKSHIEEAKRILEKLK